jgi:hypothetical protein
LATATTVLLWKCTAVIPTPVTEPLVTSLTIDCQKRRHRVASAPNFRAPIAHRSVLTRTSIVSILPKLPCATICHQEGVSVNLGLFGNRQHFYAVRRLDLDVRYFRILGKVYKREISVM